MIVMIQAISFRSFTWNDISEVTISAALIIAYASGGAVSMGSIPVLEVKRVQFFKYHLTRLYL